jgi:DNA-binding HxlR family transcriptional regulator
MSEIFKKYCPILKPIQLLGDEWILLIVKELLLSPKRFSELKNQIPEITSRTLTHRLKSMCEYGLLTRKQFAQIPPKVEYSLTDMGKDVGKILETIEDFGNKWLC